VKASQPETPPPVNDNGQLAPQVLQRVKRATVYLRVALPGGKVAMGSGFFGVEPGIILTNAHVVGLKANPPRQPLSIEAFLNSGEPDEKQLSVELIGADVGADLAVLRTSTKDVPKPLEVKSAHDLRETQKVFIFGFPFGEQLGKNITVSESSVSSLRWEAGELVAVQVNGGMHPGNSGGPLVNTRGDVIGVAVAVIRGSQIDFAVPGDAVHEIFKGRPTGVELSAPRSTPGGVTLSAKLTMVDPMNRVEEVGIDIWTGDPGKERPSSRKKPEEEPGDSAHLHTRLNYNKQGLAEGDLKLPDLPAGKVYWLQPTWVDDGHETHWATAQPSKRRS
jgi:S1-C subfamily serine protease